MLKAYLMLVDAIIGTIHYGYNLNLNALSTLQTLHFKITPYNTYTTLYFLKEWKTIAIPLVLCTHLQVFQSLKYGIV